MINKRLMMSLLFCFLPVKAIIAGELQAVTANLPPFSMNKTYKDTGFLCEVVREMTKRAKIDVTIKYWPWKRSQYIAQKKKNTLIFGITRTERREPHYAWLVNLLDTEKVFVSTSKKVDSLQDARKLRQITVRFATPFEHQLKGSGFKNYVITHSEEDNVKNLRAGKVDAWMTLSHRAAYMWKVMGHDPKSLKIGKPVSKSSLYLAGHLSLKNNTELKSKLQLAYNSMIKDGTFNKLHEKYFGRPAK